MPFASQLINLFKTGLGKDRSPAHRLANGEVLVIDWSTAQLRPGVEPLLTAAEQSRANRYSFARDRVAFVVSRAGTRSVLGELLGAPAGEIEFDTNPGGKPRLGGQHATSPLRFNLSHSGGRAMLALAWGEEVGIDLEHAPADRPAVMAVAAKCFGPEEIAALDAATAADRQEMFFRLWTRKEAVVKLTGEGLQTRLTAFQAPAEREVATWIDLPINAPRLDAPGRDEVGQGAPGDDPRQDDAPRGAGRCWLQSVSAPPDFAASVACRTKIKNLARLTLE